MTASPEIVAIETKYRGWSSMLVAQVRYPDGHTVRREIEDHGRAACVLPYDPQRRTALLVRQMRVAPLHADGTIAVLEAPAGRIDPGEAEDAAARREAAEEVGARLISLEPVIAGWTMPGISTERIHLFLGTYTEGDKGPGGGIDDEVIEVVEMPLRELAAMADAGTLNDVKTLLLIQTLRLRQPALF